VGCATLIAVLPLCVALETLIIGHACAFIDRVLAHLPRPLKSVAYLHLCLQNNIMGEVLLERHARVILKTFPCLVELRMPGRWVRAEMNDESRKLLECVPKIC